jgi:hypothetical protein
MQEYIQQAALREKRVDAVRDTFHALDNAKARERVSLQPGEHLIAGAALLHWFCIGSSYIAPVLFYFQRLSFCISRR